MDNLERLAKVGKTIKRYGLRKVITLVSGISWYIVPFLVWYEVYLIAGTSFFNPLLSIPGQLAMLGITMFFAFLFSSMLNYELKLMKKVEYLNALFEDPTDKEAEKRFKSECHRFIVPYLYFGRMTSQGIASVTAFSRVKLAQIIGLFSTLYFSYSVFTLFVANQQTIIKTATEVSKLLPDIQAQISFLIENHVYLTIILFLIGLPHGMMLFSKGYGRPRKFMRLLVTLEGFYSVSLRLGVAFALLISSPWYIRRKEKWLSYKPFIFPSSLHLTIQKAFHNVGRQPCKVTNWSYTIEDLHDVEELKALIKEDEYIHPVIKAFAVSADSREILDMLRDYSPSIYIGISKNKCAFLGSVRFDPDKGVRIGDFHFDKASLKEEFNNIADIEITEQRKLRTGLGIPEDLKGIVEKYEGKT